MKHNDQNMNTLIREGDLFIFDRGFRDAVKTLTSQYKLRVEMPTCNYYFNLWNLINIGLDLIKLI